MGVATLLIILVHSYQQGVLMTEWMESLCNIGSIGVDIFLLVSGLGMWYSLEKDSVILYNNTPPHRSLFSWYIKRYKRILLPYSIICGTMGLINVANGESAIEELFRFSTIDFWLHHRGAWYIAMLIPLYAITPLHHYICKKVKSAFLYNIVVVFILIILAAIPISFKDEFANGVLGNIRMVVDHLPAFFLGYLLAPFCKSKKSISLVWLMIVPLVIAIALNYYNIGYWPCLLVLPLVVILLWLFGVLSNRIQSILVFFGKISLESYLFNVSVGTLIMMIPGLMDSEYNYGNYLYYSLVIIVGTILSFLVNRLCNIIIR